MLTEQDRENLKLQKAKDGIRLCEEAVAKAEKYERLSDNADWKAYLDDLRVLVKLHENEIRFGSAMLLDAPPNAYVKHSKDGSGQEVVVSSKSEWIDFITRHQVQKQEAENWIKEPERILEMARQAREALPKLREQLAVLTSGGNNVE